MRAVNPLVLAALAFSALACGERLERFESVCQIVRRDEVELNDKGETESVDIEFEWDACPGDQFQVVRGGKEFAACMQKYDVGKRAPVFIKHWWDERGYFDWDVYMIGDCIRFIEESSEGSYEKAQECEDEDMYGKVTGFSCRRRFIFNVGFCLICFLLDAINGGVELLTSGAIIVFVIACGKTD